MHIFHLRGMLHRHFRHNAASFGRTGLDKAPAGKHCKIQVRRVRQKIRTLVAKSVASNSACSICYSAPVGERCIAIKLSVCVCVRVCVCVCLSVSGTAGPMFTQSFVKILCERCSVLLWWRCDTLCTSGFMNDVTFGRSEPYIDA